MAVSALMPVVYDELRRLARYYLAQERAPQTIQATALVHEAYLRLAKDKRQEWQGRTHFQAIAAIAMRRILVERARARAASKRGGSRARVTLNEALVANDDQPSEILALDVALTKLAEIAPRRARIVELRFFGGLTVDETSAVLKISPATVKRGWTIARAWLRQEMDGATSIGS
jgi:RNA polymerase sigma factor (TIGR02999 family)